MGRRGHQRVKVNMPVKISGVDKEGTPFVRTADLLDMSISGVRVAGVYLGLDVGQEIELQQGSKKARFQVVWTGKPGSSHAGEVGLSCLDNAESFNGTLPEKDDYEPSSTTHERRRFERCECNLGVDIGVDSKTDTHVTCTDISRGGCYLETWSPLPVGTKLRLIFRMPKQNLCVDGVVRTEDPSFGMGVEFLNVECPERIYEYVSARILELAKAAAATAPEQQLEISDDSSQTACIPEVPETPAIPYRVLLADDSKFLRNAYSLFLRRQGYDVIVADDGDEALRLAVSQRPDVIILDLLMPKTGGVGALMTLKSNSETANIPVIVLSGLPSSNGAKLRSVGAFAYLAKTEVGPEELPKFVAQALHEHHYSFQIEYHGVKTNLARA